MATRSARARRVSLLYRRNGKTDCWVIPALASDGRSNWTKAFAEADDYGKADGDTILTFYAAQERAEELARGGDVETAPAASDNGPTAP
jgi:hypothetical protein